MKLNRKKTRKLLFQKLYAMTFSVVNKDEFEESFYDGVFNFDRDNTYFNEMSDIIVKNEGFFIEIIKKYSPRFEFEKMNIMYILPIYMWLAEMFYLTEEIPAKVSINESVEIAKAFWDDSAKKIVNGVLNKVFHDFEELKNSSKEIEENLEYSVFKKTT